MGNGISTGKYKVEYKGKPKMKNFKKLSLTLIITPVLFMGCVGEKTSLIKPVTVEKKIAKVQNVIKTENIIKNNILLSKENTQSILKDEKPLASAIFAGEIVLEEDLESTSFNSNDLLTTPSFSSINTQNLWENFSKEDEILETARMFLGVKYIWAANGPSAFDCSGFTKYVFNESGISLPRYSGHQANIGEKIKFSQMQKGDLVFFDTTKKFRKKVNHVGIFIGDNKFIHASSAKKKVVITSFSKKKFYKKKFLYARRVLNTNENFALNISSTKKDNLVN